MNNAITQSRPHSPTVTNAQSRASRAAALPAWLQLLIGSYPQAKIQTATLAAYEAMFADENTTLMMDAVKTAVKQHKYHTFPSIGELADVVEQLKELQHQEARQAAENRARHTRNTFQKRRHYLRERAYRGEYNKAAFEELYEDLVFAGLQSTAVNLRAWMDRFEAAQ